jgi:hypothetical protein
MDMTYEQFKAEYTSAFANMIKYTVDQIGSKIWAEKMAALADAHPDWADQVEDEAA